MVDSLQTIIYFGLLKQGISDVIQYIKDYRCAKATINKVRMQPILTQSQYFNQNHSFKDQGQFLIRTSCVKSQKRNFTFDIGSNQVIKNKVPLDIYMIKCLWSMNQIFMACQYKDVRIRKQIPIITNIGLIQHQIHYESIFESKRPPGTITTIFKYSAATIALMAEFLANLLLFYNDSDTRIAGPKWGTLSLTTSLVLNTPLVLCCSFKDGEIIPEYLGRSKTDILDFLEFKQLKSLTFALLVSSMLLIMSRKPLLKAYRYVKSKLSDVWRAWTKSPKLIRYNGEVQEEQACIICYSKCRNIVFKKCKHMILCNQCASSVDNPVTTCPICREKIDAHLELMEAQK